MVTRREKEKAVAELEEKLRRAQAIVLADFQGLSVAQISLLRKMAREAGVEFKVVKNTLAALASRRAGLDGLDRLLVGPTGMALGYEDVVAPAKVLDAFGKARREELPFKGGYLEGRLLSVSEVKELAALPSRTELLGRLVRAMMGPVAGFHRVLSGNIRGLAIALNRIAEKKAGAA